ncbi:MAG TPA: glycosyltransferase family 2 protein [Phycisphaerales bacterium]|nr:glycosyltransferase family 2 protein [Phycisphaerales bacterium]
MTQTPATAPQRTDLPVVDDADLAPARTPNIAVLLVTWNRKDLVARVLEDLSRQTFPAGRLDVVVCDNASTDGTLAHLAERFAPERIVENPTTRAHEPRFEPPRGAAGPNLLGFRSLTIIRNGANFGGCGGFNTDLAFVERVLDGADSPARPDYVWLVDDDVRMPPETCRRLLAAAEADPAIGLVGTRTVHIERPGETIETTIYFDPTTGLMGDEPHRGHRLEASHRQWLAQVGAPRGEHAYSGVREVDVVSACSMLARWSAVKRVGFWDWRYFIYCDDADWCLRFAKAGYRVVLSLDATVLHTPWHHKLTPARLYYAQRNVVWLMTKLLEPPRLKRVVARRLASLLRDALRAMLMRRQFHAEIIRRTAADICAGRAGKLDFEGPPAEEIGPAMDRAGLLARGSRIAVLCCDPRALRWSETVRDAIRDYAAGQARPVPRFIEVVRNDVPGCDRTAPPGVERVLYSARRRSRLRRQLTLLRRRARAAVVFEQVNDFPLLSGAWNIHVDPKSPGRCQVERDGPGVRAAFLSRWLGSCVRCAAYAARVKPFRSADKYGGFPAPEARG